MGWLGLDDTDSLSGGCTTEVFHRLLLALPEGVTLGTPRLVRLWPFAQRRTRGNAALSIELITNNESTLLSHLDEWWTVNISPLSGRVTPSQQSNREQSPTSPGMVWFAQKPPADLYWKAVSQEVSLEELPLPTKGWGNFGRIGATAAVAWPADHGTWEAIAWRVDDALGVRNIDLDTLDAIEKNPDIVLSRDPRKGKQLIAPRGESPVLFGIRSLQQHSAHEACERLLAASGTEMANGWRVFYTNQATGDHLTDSYVADVITSQVHPQRKHVKLHTTSGTMVFFAEGGPLNSLARWFREGDRIEVKGLIDTEGVIHAEQCRLLHSVPRKKQRPLCPECGVRMKSMGQGQGVRCPQCKHIMDDFWEMIEPSPPYLGWVEPPLDARRHLSRPLSWTEE